MGFRGGKVRRRLLGVALLAVATVTLASAGQAPGQQAGDLLPDLVSDPPQNPYLQNYPSSDGNRLLLRFDGFVHNQGQGALEVYGSRPVNQAMTQAGQRIYSTNPLAPPRFDTSRGLKLIYETADGHWHWHLMYAMHYGLWNLARTSEVAPGMKVGFCLADMSHIDAHGPTSPQYTVVDFCRRYEPNAPDVRMGVSAGWRDVYASNLSFQWVDVTDVAPGEYWLGAAADPNNVIVESNEANNGAAFHAEKVVIPGHVAAPIAKTVSRTQRTEIGLAAQTVAGSDMYGWAGPRQFKIVTAPQQGTLDRAVGQVFDGSSVTYTPGPGAGSAASDSFQYVAVDASSEFPHTPPRASATLAFGASTAPSVSIAGAPASMVAGTSVQLAATVFNDVLGVTWRVDGVVGGAPGTGTITPSGLYTAPDVPPPSGTVVVRASSLNAFAEATIAIQPKQPPVPAPAPPPAQAPPVALGPPASGGGRAPDLELTQTVDRGSVRVGETVILRAQVRLGNPDASSGASGVVLTSALPAGAELVWAKSNRGPGCGGTTTVTCPLDFVSAGIVGEVELAVRLGSAGEAVTVSSVQEAEADADPADNVARTAVRVEAAVGAVVGDKAVKKPVSVVAQPTLATFGRVLVVGTKSLRAGTVQVRALKGARQVGSCSVKTPANRAVTCRMRLPKGLDAKGVRVVVRLLVAGRPVETRSVAYGRTLQYFRGSALQCWLPAPAGGPL